MSSALWAKLRLHWRPIPRTFTVVFGVGLLIGLVGLVMLLLGVGVLSPTVVQIPGIHLHIQSATPGIIVMVVGFAVALVPVVLVPYVELRQWLRSADPDNPG